MEIVILKYGNLMGSPDVKDMLKELEDNTRASDKLWDDLAGIKFLFGLNGQSTSALLLEPDCPDLFPALVDCSYLSADPNSYNDSSVRSALNAIAEHGVEPDEVKSCFVTHPHGDHFDPRLLQRLPNAKALAHPASEIPGAAPLDAAACPASFTSIDTPGHGTPHCSFIVDIKKYDMSVCFAGDLIMSHAHYLSIDSPLAFSDHKAGKKSVAAVMKALAARNTKYKMIIPGHDIPFFVKE